MQYWQGSAFMQKARMSFFFLFFFRNSFNAPHNPMDFHLSKMSLSKTWAEIPTSVQFVRGVNTVAFRGVCVQRQRGEEFIWFTPPSFVFVFLNLKLNTFFGGVQTVGSTRHWKRYRSVFLVRCVLVERNKGNTFYSLVNIKKCGMLSHGITLSQSYPWVHVATWRTCSYWSRWGLVLSPRRSDGDCGVTLQNTLSCLLNLNKKH